MAALAQSTPTLPKAFAMMRLRYVVLTLCAMLLMTAALVARAAEVDIRNATLVTAEDGYQLSADVTMELNPRLEAAINRGVPLYFVAEFELNRPRWYWLDDTVARRTLTFRLSYHALTRQYRLSSGALHQSFPTLDSALRTLFNIRHWQVADKGSLKLGERYEAELRFRLDLAQLPKPFQVGAIGNRDWNVSSDWLRWTVVPGTLAVDKP